MSDEMRPRMQERTEEIRWDKLDNTAHLFPVIAGQGMSNVYRICAVLTENIRREKLQEALDWLLPQFPVFNVRIRKGMFWYYFEENRNPAPRVSVESDWPCQYIEASRNRNYLFRVTYYKNRINLEVFHALTDGMGAFSFLRELVCQYLRLTERELGSLPHRLSEETSVDYTDSFLANYKKAAAKSYHSEHAYHLSGRTFETGKMGVVHGFLPLADVKARSKHYGASMNEFLVAAFIWAVYKEKMKGRPHGEPVAVAVPVNLRPHFASKTTKNFFVMVTAVFHPEEESYSFPEVVETVKESLRPQMEKDHLEEIFSYNVSNEKNPVLRVVPMEIKKPAMRAVYRAAAKANTTTLSNVGQTVMPPEYKPYVRSFYSFLSRSLGQNLKGCVCSYEDTMIFTITSTFTDDALQRFFFSFLREEGIPVHVEGNGVYEEVPGSGGACPGEEESRPDSSCHAEQGKLAGEYPKFSHRRGGVSLARRIYQGAAIAVFLLLFFLNVRVQARVRWDLIAGAAMLYAYLTWEVSFLHHGGYMKKILTQVFAGILTVIGLDVILGFSGWSLEFVVPGALALFDVAIVILMIVNSRNWQSYLPVQILLLVLSLIPLALFRVHLTHIRIIARLGFLVVLGIFLATVIIGGRRSRQELKRRFHL